MRRQLCLEGNWRKRCYRTENMGRSFFHHLLPAAYRGIETGCRFSVRTDLAYIIVHLCAATWTCRLLSIRFTISNNRALSLRLSSTILGIASAIFSRADVRDCNPATSIFTADVSDREATDTHPPKIPPVSKQATIKRNPHVNHPTLALVLHPSQKSISSPVLVTRQSQPPPRSRWRNPLFDQSRPAGPANPFAYSRIRSTLVPTGKP